MIKLGQVDELEFFLKEYGCLELHNDLLKCIPEQRHASQLIQKLDHAVELHTFKGNTLTEKRKDISALRDNVTIVDQEELIKAEKKLMSKRQKHKDRIRVQEIHLSSHKRITLTDEQVFQQYVAHKQAKSMDIFIEGLTLNLYGLTVLTNCDLKLINGRRYGLIGMNGIGKSTLLHAIVNHQVPIPFHLKVVYVEQEMSEFDLPILQMVLQADQLREYLLKQQIKLQESLKQHPTTELQNELNQLFIEMESADIYSAESRAASLLIGLGFKHDQLSWPQSKFSGGWKVRVALAKALFTNPDLLLLDEPTNHLDIPAVAWLSQYLLNQFKGTLLVVSHDRAFLDLVATDVLHMHHFKIKSYKGNFTQFTKTRRELTLQQQRDYDNQLKEKAHLQSFVDRFRASAARSSQAQSKLKIIEKMPDLQLPDITELDVAVVPYQFHQPQLGANISLIELRGIHFQYPTIQASIVNDLHLKIKMNSKTILVGGNGQGKSTILKLMMKTLQPTHGDCIWHGNLKIGYFSQHHMDTFQDMEQNAVEYLQSIKPGQHVQEYRSHLGGFGISGSVSLQPLHTLSGGQKSRVSFSALSLQMPNVLILDEVSNHLDIVGLTAMGEALRDFKGGLVLVSHDVKFIETVFDETHSTKQMIVVEYGKTMAWKNTDIYDYQNYCLSK